MNLANSDYQEQEFDYQVNVERRVGKEKIPRRSQMQYSRSNRPTVMHNGIHRRRNKRFAW
jgi:hypothetical protein